MAKKRQSSSIVNITDEDNLGILDVDKTEDETDNYMNVEISTDNIEDIVSSDKIEMKSPYDDMGSMDMDMSDGKLDLEVPKGIAIDDPVEPMIPIT